MDKELLSATIVRNLNDKLYEKRKIGALELETLIKDLKNQADHARIRKILQYITDNFAYSANGNSKKGGLIALAASVIGLGRETYRYISMVVPPLLNAFPIQTIEFDITPARRFTTLLIPRSLKVAGPLVLQYFCEIFDGICRLAADPDKSVQDGALLLNTLLQDIVRESDVFDLERFVPILERRIYHPHPNVRQYLIGWIRLLDSVSTLDMIEYLPNILDGMFNMLGDRQPEIARGASATLTGFLGEIKGRPPSSVQFGTLTRILVAHCICGGERPPGSPDEERRPSAAVPDEYTHYTAMGWLHQFILCGGDRILPYAADFLSCILPSLSHDVDEIRDTAILANEELLALLTRSEDLIPIEAVLQKIMSEFQNPNVETRLAALHWVRILHNKSPTALAPFFVHLFPALIKKIGDPSEKVVSFALEVMAKISQHEDYFLRLMSSLVDMFAADQGLQSARGALIIRQLSLFIDPAKIYTALSKIIASHADLVFCTTLIQTLSVILLTSRELKALRDRLRTFHRAEPSPETKETAAFFVTLYEAFSHNAVATISLCLLCELYEHATALLCIVGGYEMSVDFLCELDKLVQLIESPVFAPMRLQLLEPRKYPYLFQALFALLMILPQSTAFGTLQRRLSCVNSGQVLDLATFATTASVLSKKAEAGGSGTSVLDFTELQGRFLAIQEKQMRYRDDLRLAKNREIVADQARAGRKLIDAIKKKSTIL